MNEKFNEIWIQGRRRGCNKRIHYGLSMEKVDSYQFVKLPFKREELITSSLNMRLRDTLERGLNNSCQASREVKQERITARTNGETVALTQLSTNLSIFFLKLKAGFSLPSESLNSGRDSEEDTLKSSSISSNFDLQHRYVLGSMGMGKR